MKSNTVPELAPGHLDAIQSAMGDMPASFSVSIKPGFSGFAVPAPNNVLESIKLMRGGAVYARLSIVFAKRNFDIFFGGGTKVKGIIVLGDKNKSDQMCWICLSKFNTHELVLAMFHLQPGTEKRIGRPPKEREPEVEPPNVEPAPKKRKGGRPRKAKD